MVDFILVFFGDFCVVRLAFFLFRQLHVLLDKFTIIANGFDPPRAVKAFWLVYLVFSTMNKFGVAAGPLIGDSCAFFFVVSLVHSNVRVEKFS